MRNVGAFARFLEAVSFSHASVLNVSNVARESQVNRKTVEGYLEIMEDLLLGFRLPVFTTRARRQTAGHPKFFLFDAGVFQSLRPRGPLDRPEEIAGGHLKVLWRNTSGPGSLTARRISDSITGRPDRVSRSIL
ncbi:MAG: DUF4143 domain-containing protein [Acidobacteriota bacterium]